MANVQAADARVSPSIDVIVVTYYGRGYITACLESVAASGTSLSNIIVVDNASPDGTTALVRERFPEVRLVELEANVGYGMAINLAARQSSADYLIVLNQDVISCPGWIDELIAALERAPEYGIATPKILLRSDPTLLNACGNDTHVTGLTTCRGYGRRSTTFSQPHAVAAVSGAAFGIRRELFERLGGFEPLFFMYLEDTDMSLRAALLGLGSVCVPSASVIHDFHPSFAPQKLFWLERNRALLVLRLYKLPTLVGLLPALLLVEALVLGYSIFSGRRTVSAKLRAYTWLMRHRSSILASRREVQRSRQRSDREILANLNRRLSVDELPGRLPKLAALAANPFLGGWATLVRSVVRW